MKLKLPTLLPENFVICSYCGARVRANTANGIMRCHCASLMVRGGDASFTIGRRVEDLGMFLIILAHPRNYMLDEDQQWSSY